MTNSDIIGLIATSSIGLALVVFSILLLKGKGSFLIAGFNTMSKEEQNEYDKKALCRFMGKIFLPIGVLTPLVAIAGIYDIGWLNTAYVGLLFVLIVFALVYCNTGNRFKK